MAITVNRQHVWPSSGFGKKREKAEQNAEAILASCSAIEQIVAALAAGKVAAPDVTGASECDLHFAPYFSPRRGHNELGPVPYTARWLESVLIAGGARSRWLRVAMLCEPQAGIYRNTTHKKIATQEERVGSTSRCGYCAGCGTTIKTLSPPIGGSTFKSLVHILIYGVHTDENVLLR
jgi:hypothetical protein